LSTDALEESRGFAQEWATVVKERNVVFWESKGQPTGISGEGGIKGMSAREGAGGGWRRDYLVPVGRAIVVIVDRGEGVRGLSGRIYV